MDKHKDRSAGRRGIRRDVLKRLVPPASLSWDDFYGLADDAQAEELPAAATLFREGECDESIVYLLAGEVELSTRQGHKSIVEAGTFEARVALAEEQPRPVSARALTPITVARFDRAKLENLLTRNQASLIEVSDFLAEDEAPDEGAGRDWMTTILQSRAFERLSPRFIQAIFSRLTERPATAGEVIVRQSEEGDFYYFIVRGTCRVTRETSTGARVTLAELGPGDSFGEEALLVDGNRVATVTMITDGHLARLSKPDFQELLEAPLLREVNLAEARQLVEGKGVFLDVSPDRTPGRDGAYGGEAVPLFMLRFRIDELDRGVSYICHCDEGQSATVAAFLLSERGFDAYLLNPKLERRPGTSPARSVAAAARAAETEFIVDFAESNDGPPAPVPPQTAPASAARTQGPLTGESPDADLPGAARSQMDEVATRAADPVPAEPLTTHEAEPTDRDPGEPPRPGRGELEPSPAPDAPAHCLEALFEAWMRESRSKPGGSLSAAVEKICRRHLIPRLGALALDDLTARPLQDYLHRALEVGRLDGKRGLAPSTVAKHRRILGQVLNFGVERQYLRRNPLGDTEPWTDQARPVYPLDEPQVCDLLAGAADPVLSIGMWLAIGGGVSSRDLCRLRWRDLEGERLALERPGAGVRTVILPPRIVSIIRGLRPKRCGREDDWLTGRENGEPCQPSELGDAFDELARDLGMQGCRYDDLVHFHAARRLQAGVDPRLVSEHLGDANVAVTLERYRHLYVVTEEAAAAALETALARIVEGAGS